MEIIIKRFRGACTVFHGNCNAACLAFYELLAGELCVPGINIMVDICFNRRPGFMFYIGYGKLSVAKGGDDEPGKNDEG